MNNTFINTFFQAIFKSQIAYYMCWQMYQIIKIIVLKMILSAFIGPGKL